MLATSQTCNICDNCLQREKLQYIFPTAAAALQEDAAEVMPTELSPRHLRHSAFVDDFVQLCAHRHSISSIFYSTARCCMLYGLTLLLFLFYSHARHSIIAMKSWHLMGFHHVAVRSIHPSIHIRLLVETVRTQLLLHNRIEKHIVENIQSNVNKLDRITFW